MAKTFQAQTIAGFENKTLEPADDPIGSPCSHIFRTANIGLRSMECWSNGWSQEASQATPDLGDPLFPRSGRTDAQPGAVRSYNRQQTATFRSSNVEDRNGGRWSCDPYKHSGGSKEDGPPQFEISADVRASLLAWLDQSAAGGLWHPFAEQDKGSTAATQKCASIPIFRGQAL